MATRRTLRAQADGLGLLHTPTRSDQSRARTHTQWAVSPSGLPVCRLLAALALRRPTYLSQQSDLLRSAALALGPWYYEGHNSADGHRRFCRFSLEEAGFAEADWSVETVNSDGN